MSWSVSLSKDANNVKEALQQAISTIHKFHPKHLTTVLVADGGGENHNMTIDELLRKTTNPEISKVIALKDIIFSNSPVEAINKIIKRYLRIYMPDDLDKLIAYLKIIVEDYNEKRPHGSLFGLTPFEAHTNTFVDLDFKEQKIDAGKLRVQENKNTDCDTCM